MSAVAAKVAASAASPAVRASANAVSCVANSFVPGTAVLLADGTTVPIEDVQLGDEVLATDPETGESGPRPVTALITGDGEKDLTTITIAGQGGDDAGTVVATDGHPFWVPDLGRWVDAGELLPGDWLYTSAGTLIQVSALQHERREQAVHNLTVAGIHTYYVTIGTGTDAVLVHNCAGGGASAGGVNLSLSYKPGWSAAQQTAADGKVLALNNAAQAGTLRVTTAQRGGTSSSSRYRSAGGSIPQGADVDHTIDLQLGGLDALSNMSPLDSSVNRSLGSQIMWQLRGVAPGACVVSVTIC